MKNLNELITIVKKKNGTVKITQDTDQKHSMCKYINEIGFFKTMINKRVVFFKKIEGELFYTSFDEIRTTFWKKFENSEFSNIPSNVSYKEILNWYLGELPLKDNKVLNKYLFVNLDALDQHRLRIQYDHDYSNEFNTIQLLQKFKDWGFSKTVNSICDSKNNNPIYYKRIGENKYLGFNHYCSKNRKLDGFDCWIWLFSKESDIGKKTPIDTYEIKLSFNLEKDFNLIANLLP